MGSAGPGADWEKIECYERPNEYNKSRNSESARLALARRGRKDASREKDRRERKLNRMAATPSLYSFPTLGSPRKPGAANPPAEGRTFE